MRRAVLIAGALAAQATVARADDPRPVRSTATVEVIEDNKHVDDIIARVRAEQAAAASARPTEKLSDKINDKPVDKSARPPLPVTAPAPHDAASDRMRHLSQHVDHERHTPQKRR